MIIDTLIDCETVKIAEKDNADGENTDANYWRTKYLNDCALQPWVFLEFLLQMDEYFLIRHVRLMLGCMQTRIIFEYVIFIIRLTLYFL